MNASYEAVLQDGRIEWIGTGPGPLSPEQRIRVLVTWLEPSATQPSPERSQKMKAALDRLAASNVYAKFGDPLEWQLEERQDRPLPGRED